MRKFSILLIIFVSANHLFGQVTIGSTTTPPTGSLLNLQEFIPTDNNATAKGGFLLPRVDILNQTDLSSINPSATSSDKSNLTGLTLYNIGSGISSGLKIWDGSSWKGFLNDDYIVPVSNGISISNDKVVLGGILDTPTTITSTTAGNNLEFTSTADSSNLLITGNAKVGIGTNSPVNTFHLNGTFAFVEGVYDGVDNAPNSIDYSYHTMMVSETDGNVVYAPRGATRSIGGYRPAEANVNYIIAKLKPLNTMLRVSFVCYVNSDDSDTNSDSDSYTYGDFTIIGRSTASPASFVEKNIKGYDGNAKTLSVDTSTTITWLEGSTPYTIQIDQSTGELSINNGSDNHSFMFQIFGDTRSKYD